MKSPQGGFLFIYPQAWRGNAPSMTNRYKGLIHASGGWEPPEEVRRACVVSAFSEGEVPDLLPWVERAERVVIGVSSSISVRFIQEVCRSFPGKVVLSWHDPFPETQRDREAELVLCARWHIVPTRAHADHLRSQGAQEVFSATPLLEDLRIPRLDRGWSYDIGHLGWVGGGGRDMMGLVKGVKLARCSHKPWRVIQFGPLPRRLFVRLLPYRLWGILAVRMAVPQERVVEIYPHLRFSAVLQVGSFYGDLCIPGKLIETVLMGCPPICDRRGKLLAHVCDEVGLPSWGRPSEIPEIFEVLDGFCGEGFARRLGFVIAEYSLSECFAHILSG